MEKETRNKLEPGFWIGIVIILVLLLCVCLRSPAQTRQPATYDTICCNYAAIKKYVEKSTPKTVRVYAVYDDVRTGISDIIFVTKPALDYISICKENGIEPSLVIRLKNGEVYSIIKLPKKYAVQRQDH